uniref:VOC domain-containing protein n=1 Tax=Cucumis melo TaxID=3656 RepID=A0A9I9D4G6_CUCME
MAFPVARAASLAHIARESSNIHRLSQFYKEMFGFEEIESPDFGALKVIWLNLPSAFQLHLIERDPNSKLPEGPCSATSPVADPSHLPRGHHICFSVPISNFDSLVHALKKVCSSFYMHYSPNVLDMGGLNYVLLQEKGIQTFEKTLPNGKVKQVFFFDPDGNGLEIASRED